MFENDKEQETLSVWQSQRLAQVVQRVYEKNFIYQRKLEQCQLQPQDIQHIEDISKLPFTTLEEVEAGFPYALLTMPVSGVAQVAVHGKTGYCYTRRDMEGWQTLVAGLLAAGGVNAASVFQLAVPPREMQKHLALYQGVLQLGATWVPTAEDMGQQLRCLQEFGVTAIYGEPGYLLQLGESLEKAGVSPYQLPLQVIFTNAHVLGEALRSELQLRYGVKVVALWGTETPFAMPLAGECHLPDGLHIAEEAFYAEVIDPQSGGVLPAGEQGELVLTSLLLEAMPLLRYRTGIAVVLENTPCFCGQTSLRIKKI